MEKVKGEEEAKRKRPLIFLSSFFYTQSLIRIRVEIIRARVETNGIPSFLLPV